MFRNSIDVLGDAGVTFSEQPLPCPFCGSSEFRLHGDILPKFVACKKCSAFGPTALTVSQAIERWNIRQGGDHLFEVDSRGESVMGADSDIRRDVEDELRWDPDIDAADIAVTVRNGVVALTGVVRSYIQNYQAELDAKQVAGVVAVANGIQIRLPDVDERPDAEIAREAVARIKDELPYPRDKIRLIVKDGWLTLEGDVEWNYQRERAEEAVRRALGVKGITNSIKVKPHAAPMEIRFKIEKALRRAAELDANRITVETSGGEVILRGMVRSCAERQQAERAAWLAPGVAKIDNRISIDPFARRVSR